MTQPDTRPKVLFVSAFPPPNRGVANVMQGFWDSYLHSKYRMGRVNLTRSDPDNIRSRLHWRNVLSTLRHWMAVANKCLLWKPEVVNVVYNSNLALVKAWGIAVIARLFGCHVVAHLHGGGFDDFYHHSSVFVRNLVRLSLRPAERWIATGSYWKSLLIEMQVDEWRIQIVPNPQRAEVMESLPKTDYPIQGVPQILFVGIGGFRKGLDILAQALQILREHGQTFKAVIVGGEEVSGERAEIQMLFARLFDKSSYQFIEYLDGSQYFDLLRQSTVFVLPSRQENFPMALCEAMAMGLPVVSTPVGAVTEFLEHGENGLIVPVEDAKSLASAIECLLADETLRRNLGQAASTTIRQSLAPDLLAQRLDQVFMALLEQR